MKNTGPQVLYAVHTLSSIRHRVLANQGMPTLLGVISSLHLITPVPDYIPLETACETQVMIEG